MYSACHVPLLYIPAWSTTPAAVIIVSFLTVVVGSSRVCGRKTTPRIFIHSRASGPPHQTSLACNVYISHDCYCVGRRSIQRDFWCLSEYHTVPTSRWFLIQGLGIWSETKVMELSCLWFRLLIDVATYFFFEMVNRMGRMRRWFR